MLTLNNLTDTCREPKSSKRVGRGIGSKGVTCGRGQKGQGARSGYKRRFGNEGGQRPLYKKVPTRGFSNVRFRKELDSINLDQINSLYKDGEVVNVQTLKAKGYISGKSYGIKILGNGNLNVKVSFEVEAISAGARDKLHAKKISFTINGAKED